MADQVYYLSAAAGVAGDAAVQWARVAGSDPLNVETVFRPRGDAFGPPVPMTSYTGTAGGSSANAIAVDGAGNVESVFIESVGTAQRATSRLRASNIGLWQLPQLVALPTPGYTLSVPAVAFDAQGGAVAVLVRGRLHAPEPIPATPAGCDAACPAWASPGRQPHSSPTPPAPTTASPSPTTSSAPWLPRGSAAAQRGRRSRAAVRPPGGPFSPAAVVGLGANRSVAVDAGGNALVGSRGSGNEARVAVYDATPPVIAAVSVPAALTTGQPGAFGATVVDAWAGLAAGSPTWSFGDGTAAPGPAATHAYGGAGSFPATLGAVDAVGNAASVAAGTVAVTDPPVDPQACPP